MGKEDHVEHNNFDCLSPLPPSITYTFTGTYRVHVEAPPLGLLDIRTRACYFNEVNFKLFINSLKTNTLPFKHTVVRLLMILR